MTTKRTRINIQRTYAVSGGFAHLAHAKDNNGQYLPDRYDFRCAELTTRDTDTSKPPSLMITVAPKSRHDHTDGPPAHDQIEIWSPTYQFFDGLMIVRGFGIEYVLDGTLVDNGGDEPGDNYATESGAGVHLVEVCVIPESDLNENGTRK